MTVKMEGIIVYVFGEIFYIHNGVCGGVNYINDIYGGAM